MNTNKYYFDKKNNIFIEDLPLIEYYNSLSSNDLIQKNIIVIPETSSKYEKYRKHFIKKGKIKDVSKLFVTTDSGKVFDADEKSQDRMVRALLISSLNGQLSTEWKLYDNTIVIVTYDELKDALIKAGNAMSQIWLKNEL